MSHVCDGSLLIVVPFVMFSFLGLPKPALFAQDRALRATCVMEVAGILESDVVYTALPLYHSAGLGIALGSTARFGKNAIGGLGS